MFAGGRDSETLRDWCRTVRTFQHQSDGAEMSWVRSVLTPRTRSLCNTRVESERMHGIHPAFYMLTCISAMHWTPTHFRLPDFPPTRVLHPTFYTCPLPSEKVHSHFLLYPTGASQLVTRSTRHSPKSYDELTGSETPCCDELTGASNAVPSLLWRVNRMLLSA